MSSDLHLQDLSNMIQTNKPRPGWVLSPVFLSPNITFISYLFILNSSLESWTCRPTPCCRSSKPINPEAVKYFLAPAPSLEDSKVLLSLHVFLSSLRWFHSINVTKRWRWLGVIMIWKMARIVRWWLCWHVGTFGGEEEWEWSPVDWQNLELALTGVELEYRQ